MKLSNKVIFSAGMMFAGAALAGYFERTKDEKILVRGRIDKMFFEDERLSEIDVVGIKYDDTEMDRALIRVDESTRIIKKFTNDNITTKNLKKDDIVEIVIDHKEVDAVTLKPRKIILMT